MKSGLLLSPWLGSGTPSKCPGLNEFAFTVTLSVRVAETFRVAVHHSRGAPSGVNAMSTVAGTGRSWRWTAMPPMMT